MTAYRFRVKFDPDPTSLWRDIVVGADRTIADFQSTINPAVGLDQDHYWFVGEGENFWDSSIKYRSPRECEGSSGVDRALHSERIENAGDVRIGEMTRQVGLERYDRLCYLYDYGDEWRFYAILKEIISEKPSDAEPAVVRKKGDPIDQYDSTGTGDRDSSLPEPLPSVLPETAVPVSDLRALEERDPVVHVLVLMSYETGFGAVCERFAIQFADGGYVIENFQPGWQVVERVDGEHRTAEELLAALADAVREWHAEIAEITSATTGRQFDEETIDAMDVELVDELERRGYGHL